VRTSSEAAQLQKLAPEQKRAVPDRTCEECNCARKSTRSIMFASDTTPYLRRKFAGPRATYLQPSSQIHRIMRRGIY
jgi:hypothetical protein